MIKYNSDNLVVGYIKELLKDFNLLKFKLYNRPNYLPNEKILNITKNLNINSLIYDSYTHTYLGDYLRYLRDYKDLDLMSMYNCFTYDMPKNFDISLEDSSITFNSLEDSSHKYFIFPVRAGAKYTIAMTCPFPVEFIMVAYDEEHLIKTYESTYMYNSNLRFNSPILYDKIPNDINKDGYSSIWKLVIKMPYNCSSTITVLEGDYTQCSKKVFLTSREDTIYSKPICIGETQNKDSYNLQLLNLNDGTSYPFADRLLEYLTGNVITNVDDIPNNIVRTQKALIKKKIIKDFSTINYGKWSSNMNNYILDYLNKRKLDTPYLNNLFDILGYVDKDIEDENVLAIKDGEE